MEATPAEKRRVVVTSTTGADLVCVSVRDFGTGLPADNPEKIFEHFFSAKPDGWA